MSSPLSPSGGLAAGIESHSGGSRGFLQAWSRPDRPGRSSGQKPDRRFNIEARIDTAEATLDAAESQLDRAKTKNRTVQVAPTQIGSCRMIRDFRLGA
jgi:hypothetical protein